MLQLLIYLPYVMRTVNVWIQVMFTIDVRSKDDSNRETNVVRIESEIRKICRKRGVGCVIERKVYI